MSDPRPPRWLKPMNKIMIAVQKLGIPTGPAMVLTVPGRQSGRPRSTPMTPFTLRGTKRERPQVFAWRRSLAHGFIAYQLSASRGFATSITLSAMGD
jgi:hypothetical protein